MKKTAKIFVTVSAAVVALTVLPWIVRILTIKPEQTIVLLQKLNS